MPYINPRRQWLRAGAGLSLTMLGLPAEADDAAVLAALRHGGVVALFRHADAPGTFDPPGFRLGECGTQRNLGDEGRAQARRIGAWFRERGLKPRRVRSSPWCRCLDTATLAFGDAEAWPALSSTIGGGDAAQQVPQMLDALRAVSASGFEVWVSHQVTIGALVNENTSQGEALLVQAAAGGARAAQVVGRFRPG